VGELPLRYAPFFAQLAALWHAPESAVVRELGSARAPKRWSRTLVRGLTVFEPALGLRGGGRARLLRFMPGTRFPRHRHLGAEEALVLEGAYRDAAGHEQHPGQLQRMAAGSAHELHILGSVPCVTAVAEDGIAIELGSLLRGWLRR
jgi:anti-sigma factor ChrR (cupin superfamily)